MYALFSALSGAPCSRSRAANGVSQRHGVVAREMWRPLWPQAAPDAVPITHVTNGVHTTTWMADPMQRLLDRHLPPDWRARLAEPAVGAVLINNKISNVCAPEGVPDSERLCREVGHLLHPPYHLYALYLLALRLIVSLNGSHDAVAQPPQFLDLLDEVSGGFPRAHYQHRYVAEIGRSQLELQKAPCAEQTDLDKPAYGENQPGKGEGPQDEGHGDHQLDEGEPTAAGAARRSRWQT